VFTSVLARRSVRANPADHKPTSGMHPFQSLPPWFITDPRSGTLDHPEAILLTYIEYFNFEVTKTKIPACCSSHLHNVVPSLDSNLRFTKIPALYIAQTFLPDEARCNSQLQVLHQAWTSSSGFSKKVSLGACQKMKMTLPRIWQESQDRKRNATC
jgi:hypothetical protein